jgi:hypothetical protein
VKTVLLLEFFCFIVLLCNSKSVVLATISPAWGFPDDTNRGFWENVFLRTFGITSFTKANVPVAKIIFIH